MITLRNVTSPSETPSVSGLDALSLTIGEGEVVSLVGLTTFGRRRLLGVLGLYSDDWSGEYELFGHQVHKLDDEARATLRGELIGAMMRCAPLVECLSVEENLEIPLSYRGVPPQERDGLIADALARLGVQSIRESDVGFLAEDQRQLVGIAKAFVSTPRLVLLEDPMMHLNALQLRMVRLEIDRMRRGGCIVVQSHEHPEAGVNADRIVELQGAAPDRRGGRRPSLSRVRLNSAAGIW